jgi:RimJ/RimL family protein N-acetyltransferase
LEIKFVPFDEVFLEICFDWLQDESLRRLIDSPPITRESHQLWFQQLGKRNNYHVWCVIANESPIGVCGLKHVNNGKGEYWGYIGVKSHWGNGIGTKMLDFIEAFARALKIGVIELRVLKGNHRAFDLYLRNGFVVSKQLEDTIFMEKKLADD